LSASDLTPGHIRDILLYLGDDADHPPSDNNIKVHISRCAAITASARRRRTPPIRPTERSISDPDQLNLELEDIEQALVAEEAE